MQLTYEGAAYFPPEQQVLVVELMRRYQTVKRIAFNRLLEGQSRQDIVEHIRQLGLLSNARYIRSAFDEAKALLQSQKELLSLYYWEAQWRAQSTENRLTDYQQHLATQHKPFSFKQRQRLKKLKRRSQQAESKLAYWKKHLQNKTLPPIIFGGKQRFHSHQQGKLPKAEWQHRRANSLYCVGEKNCMGNNNLRVHYQSANDSFTFSMLLDGGKRGERLTAPLYVPAPFKATFQRHAQGDHAYTVRVMVPDQGEHVRVLVASDHVNPTVPNGQGIAGFDLNPAGIAVTVLHPNGNFRATRWFEQPVLMYARKGKRQGLVGALVKQSLTWVAAHGVNTLAVEALHFLKQYGANHQSNRAKANFVYSQLLTTIHVQALKAGFYVQEVTPAFTSIIGELKYAPRYGLNGHQAAALVIGRRGLGLGDKLQDYANGSLGSLLVPTMDGWTAKKIATIKRDIKRLTIPLGT